MGRRIKSRQGRGALIISHRASSLAKADVVAVLRDGRVAEIGAFDELVAAGGYLSRLAALARLGGDAWRPPSTRPKAAP
jgi:ATP-binding cassette subfamily B protein